MRLALISQDFPPDTGGVQTYSVELARRFADRCEQLVVLAPDRPQAERVDRHLEFPVVRVEPGGDAFPLGAIRPLRRLLADRSVRSVYHAQWASLLASIGAGWTGRPPRRRYCAAHGRELLIRPFGDGVLQRGYDRIRRSVLGSADHWFPVSRYTADLLRAEGVPNDRLTVVGNGTDPDRFRPMDLPSLGERLTGRDVPVLLTVGRLVRRKGVGTVLRAVDRLRAAYPDLLYVIAGDGPDRARLETLTRELGLEEHVRFEGRIPHEDLPGYYNGCDVFVMVAESRPPDVEGFGIVFLEANACGRPVVGARAGGIPDAIREGETGRLVTPGDPEELASVLDELLAHPERAERLGRRGRDRVLEQANWSHVADRLLARMRTIEH